MGSIKIISDSTCDLSQELIKKYNIGIIPLNIVLDNGKSYLDGAEITPDEIYTWADKAAATPKTAAPNLDYVVNFFKPYQAAGDTLICFSISTDMSSCNHVMHLAAQELGYDNVYIIDSLNLSTGIGLQVIKAAELAQRGTDAQQIVDIINNCRNRVRASFVVDTLTYLYRGGRCTAVAALFGTALKLKPRIEVANGKMGVSRKYRGAHSKVVLQYVKDMQEALLNAEPEHVFITHSGIQDEICQSVKQYLESLNYFKQIHITRAGGVISSHCGFGTLGVLFYEK